MPKNEFSGDIQERDSRGKGSFVFTQCLVTSRVHLVGPRIGMGIGPM